MSINKVSCDFERIYGISLVPLVPRGPRCQFSRWRSCCLCFAGVLRSPPPPNPPYQPLGWSYRYFLSLTAGPSTRLDDRTESVAPHAKDNIYHELVFRAPPLAPHKHEKYMSEKNMISVYRIRISSLIHRINPTIMKDTRTS